MVLGHPSGDLHAGAPADLPQNLVQARIVGLKRGADRPCTRPRALCTPAPPAWGAELGAEPVEADAFVGAVGGSTLCPSRRQPRARPTEPEDELERAAASLWFETYANRESPGHTPSLVHFQGPGVAFFTVREPSGTAGWGLRPFWARLALFAGFTPASRHGA